MPHAVYLIHESNFCNYINKSSTQLNLNMNFLCPQVLEDVVHVDYSTNEAVRDVGGREERAKLVEGAGGFSTCTWMDGTQWQSKVANLMFSGVMAQALRVSAKFAKKKPAAA